MTDSGLATLDTEPASTRRGTWSVVLAVASPIVGFAVGVVGLFVAAAQGSLSDPRFGASMVVSNWVATAIAWSTAVAAVILGVASIVHAWPQHGRPRRTKAIVLGCIGISLAVVLTLFNLSELSPIRTAFI